MLTIGNIANKRLAKETNDDKSGKIWNYAVSLYGENGSIYSNSL
jgi:hypothetical protein